jgi:hypothetical protein
VEERLLLDRIDLETGNVPARDPEPAVVIEANPANSVQPLQDHAPVTASEAANLAGVQRLRKSGRALAGTVSQSPLQRLDRSI